MKVFKVKPEGKPEIIMIALETALDKSAIKNLFGLNMTIPKLLKQNHKISAEEQLKLETIFSKMWHDFPMSLPNDW
jgi:hypothetical protein